MPEPTETEVIVSAEQRQAEVQYLDRLRAEIAKNRVYPRQARRKKKQGTVKVSFSIAANGLISQVEVVSSSGVDGLDRAAVAAVSAVGQFESFPESFASDTKTITVPVSFKLR